MAKKRTKTTKETEEIIKEPEVVEQLTKEPEKVETEQNDDFECMIPLSIRDKDSFNVQEAAVIVDKTERCVRDWITQGKLEAVKVFGCVRIPKVSLLKGYRWYQDQSKRIKM